MPTTVYLQKYLENHTIINRKKVNLWNTLLFMGPRIHNMSTIIRHNHLDLKKLTNTSISTFITIYKVKSFLPEFKMPHSEKDPFIHSSHPFSIHRSALKILYLMGRDNCKAYVLKGKVCIWAKRSIMLNTPVSPVPEAWGTRSISAPSWMQC